MIKEDRFREILKNLMREDDTPERVDYFNELLTGVDFKDYEDLTPQMAELQAKYDNLETRYRETFKQVLEGKAKEETADIQEDVPVDNITKEEATTFDDIFKD